MAKGCRRVPEVVRTVAREARQRTKREASSYLSDVKVVVLNEEENLLIALSTDPLLRRLSKLLSKLLVKSGRSHIDPLRQVRDLDIARKGVDHITVKLGHTQYRPQESCQLFAAIVGTQVPKELLDLQLMQIGTLCPVIKIDPKRSEQ